MDVSSPSRLDESREVQRRHLRPRYCEHASRHWASAALPSVPLYFGPRSSHIRFATNRARCLPIRSLVISQRLLGTREIILIHHTDRGMLTFRDDEVKAAIAEDVGQLLEVTD